MHYGSDRPARLGAHAYAQGREIHLGPGQERHLPHEAWHVVQQAQHRVSRTGRLPSGEAVNDNGRLEFEAQRMGTRAADLATGGFHRQATTSSAPVAGGAALGVVQRQKFGAETTFGMELEFTNRWMSLQAYGKDLVPTNFAPDKIFKGSPEMKVGGDDGRGGTTVMEIESRVFGRGDWGSQAVQQEVDAIMVHASEIIETMRGGTYEAYAEADLDAMRDELGDPLTGIHDPLLEAGDVQQRLPALLQKLEPSDQATTKEKKDFQEKSDYLSGLFERLVEGQSEVPKATLQVTTLGRKSAGHYEALRSVSGEIESKNQKDLSDYPVPFQVSEGAEEWIVQLLERLKPKPTASLQVHESFLVTLECLVKMVLFAELGVDSSGFGTMKNMPHALPRRTVTPPPEGFAAALDIPKGVYDSTIAEIWERLDRAWNKNRTPADPLAQQVHAMLRRGLSKPASKKYDKRAKAFALDPENQKSPRPFSLWTIEGGEPTLESKIIADAKKPDPDEWAAHEIRNFGWAMGQDRKSLASYLEIVGKHAV